MISESLCQSAKLNKMLMCHFPLASYCLRIVEQIVDAPLSVRWSAEQEEPSGPVPVPQSQSSQKSNRGFRDLQHEQQKQDRSTPLLLRKLHRTQNCMRLVLHVSKSWLAQVSLGDGCTNVGDNPDRFLACKSNDIAYFTRMKHIQISKVCSFEVRWHNVFFQVRLPRQRNDRGERVRSWATFSFAMRSLSGAISISFRDGFP